MYIYRALERQHPEIRLLELLPGQYIDPIRANIVHVSLPNASLLTFETVSYVWGDSLKSVYIEISGQRLSIPTGTDAALRRMRYSHEARLLWIDAICINQDDTTERGQQVELMSRIYSSSEGNLIHLTDDEVVARPVWDAIMKIDGEARLATKNYTGFSKTVRNPITGDFKYSPVRTEDYVDVEAVQHLLSFRWFRRLWVVQEARLAPKNTCFIGSMTISLEIILRVLCWLDHIGQLPRSTVDQAASRRCIAEMFDLVDQDHGRFGRKDVSFYQLLIMAQNYEKTELRDAVFATLGMLKTPPLGLRPDYTQPLGSVLQLATRAVISQGNDLNILRFVNHRVNDELATNEIASWARRADWQYDANIDARPFQNYFGNDIHGFPEPSTLQDTPSNPATLLLEGIRLDQIAALTTPCLPSDFHDIFRFEAWLYTGLKSLDAAMERHPHRLSRTATAAALCAQRAVSGGCANDKDLKSVRQYIDCILDADDSPGSTSDLLRQQRREAYDAMWLHCNIGDVRNRLMFVTVFGSIGLGPRIAQENDVVAIIRGATYPLILRNSGKDYQFVGAAYVYEIMNGDAVRQQRVQSKEEIFVVH